MSFSSQEWCGNVFHQVIPRPAGLVSEIHSYFEAEGDATTTGSRATVMDGDAEEPEGTDDPEESKEDLPGPESRGPTIRVP